MKTYEQAKIALQILQSQAKDQTYLEQPCPDCSGTPVSDAAEDTLLEFLDQDGQELLPTYLGAEATFGSTTETPAKT